MQMKHSVSFALFALLLAGCETTASWGIPYTHFWGGSSRTSSPDDVAIGNPNFYIQNLNSEQKAKFKTAFAKAMNLIESEEFQDQVNARTYRRACDKDDRVSGEELLSDIRETMSPDVYARRPAGANAQTSFKPPRIAIAPKSITGDENALINTIIHEMTHLVPSEGVEINPKYRDRGVGNNNCEKADLASYSIGEIAERVASE